MLGGFETPVRPTVSLILGRLEETMFDQQFFYKFKLLAVGSVYEVKLPQLVHVPVWLRGTVLYNEMMCTKNT